MNEIWIPFTTNQKHYPVSWVVAQEVAGAVLTNHIPKISLSVTCDLLWANHRLAPPPPIHIMSFCTSRSHNAGVQEWEGPSLWLVGCIFPHRTVSRNSGSRGLHIPTPTTSYAETHGAEASEWLSKPPSHCELKLMVWGREGFQRPTPVTSCAETHHAGVDLWLARTAHSTSCDETHVAEDQNCSQSPHCAVSRNSWYGGYHRPTVATSCAETHSVGGSEWLSKPPLHHGLKLMVRGAGDSTDLPLQFLCDNSRCGVGLLPRKSDGL